MTVDWEVKVWGQGLCDSRLGSKGVGTGAL